MSETASELVAQGRSALSGGTLESNDRAGELFERALGAEPQCAPAYVGLAIAYLERAGELRLGPRWLELAINAGEKAVELDSFSPDGYRVLDALTRR